MEGDLQVNLPPRLAQQLQFLVSEGWFSSESEVVLEALRRFLDVHEPDLMEQFIREDVDWGLHGDD